MKRLKLACDIGKCVGCRVCELVCSFKHEGKFNAKQSRIRILSYYPNPGIDLPIYCRQCDDPKCVEACPQGSIVRGTKGVVIVENDKCVGCKACLSACPIRALYWDPQRNVPIKCDLCGGSPTCVKYCAHGALKLLDAQEAAAVPQDVLQEFLKGSRDDTFGEYLNELVKVKSPE